MYVVDKAVIHDAMAQRGFKSVQSLASFLGVHRNTIHHYLSGRPILPSALERILEALDLRLEHAIVRTGEEPGADFEPIADLVDRLHALFPDVTFVLFGSRSRGKHARYADWDIGVYRAKGLSHSRYRSILLKLRDEEDSLPYYVDLVNLNRADGEFLSNLAKSWVFLTGSRRDWLHLQRKVTDG
jgi:predicted nucleotidyltransferase